MSPKHDTIASMDDNTTKRILGFPDEFWIAFVIMVGFFLKIIFDVSSGYNFQARNLGAWTYLEPGQAHGLCFSVPAGIAVPPSLVNIIKEINSDLGTQIPLTCGDLTGWAEQGVLLLNATLTVRAHQAGSHQHRGWELFTDAAIQALAQRRTGIVFMLWGSFAISKAQYIDRSRHYVLTAPHPSPLSAYRGFFGCRHFSQCNAILQQQGLAPIDWTRIS